MSRTIARTREKQQSRGGEADPPPMFLTNLDLVELVDIIAIIIDHLGSYDDSQALLDEVKPRIERLQRKEQTDAQTTIPGT